MLYKPAATLVMEKTNVDETIQSTITKNVLPANVSQDENAELITNLPDFIIRNSENTVQSIAKTISITLIETCTFLIIFIVVKIILEFVTILADFIAKLPILKQFNKLGGTVYGFLEGIFIIFVGFSIISLVAPLLDINILDSINSSYLASILYNHNILLKFIVK